MDAAEVVIVGAGPAGLTLANLLLRNGIGCVVLEKRSRSYLEDRQRAGVLDAYAGQIFVDAGLEEQILSGAHRESILEIRHEGRPRLLDATAMTGGRASYAVPQQIVVRRLVATFLAAGGDLRFEAGGTEIHDIGGTRPRVTFEGGTLEASYVAGCDGFHGVSRPALTDSSVISFDHGIGWYTVLAESPAPRYPTMGVSRHGFAAQFQRGPAASRFYLQYPLDGTDPRQWPDPYTWEQLRLRLGDPSLPEGPIVAREIVEMRSHVVEPMASGRLFLAGDAAHIITPMGAKGMNLAIADAALLASALTAALRSGDDSELAAYSDKALARTWNHQEFSRWFTEATHDLSDMTEAGAFRRRLALARLDRLFSSPPAMAAFADLTAGTVF